MRFSCVLSAASVILCITFGNSHGIAGVGVHYGIDLSLTMDDTYDQALSVAEYKEQFAPDSVIRGFSGMLDTYLTNVNYSTDELLDSLNSYTGTVPVLSGELPFSLSRYNFSKTVFNLGGKVFLDIIPVLDAIELSFNFGVWEYRSVLHYPKGIDPTITDPAFTLGTLLDDPSALTWESLFVMDSIPLTLKQFDMNYFGLDETPYAKLHFDLTVRKNIVAVPKRMKIFRLYAGGGPTAIFATPVITQSLMESALAEIIDTLGTDFSALQTLSSMAVSQSDLLRILKDVVLDATKITEPKFGMHLILGSMVKLPVVPIGFYVDGKFQIPFGRLDEEAGLKGVGVMVNAGMTVGL